MKRSPACCSFSFSWYNIHIRVFLGRRVWGGFLDRVLLRRSYAKFRGKYLGFMATKLYVGGLPYSTTQEELQDAFAKAGSVVSAAIIIDKMTGRSRGFGFVEMGSDAEAQAAVDMWNGKDFGGRNLTVNLARPKEEGAPRREWRS